MCRSLGKGASSMGERSFAYWLIVAAAILASPTAEAQPAKLTLACKGTTMTQYIDEKPQPISMGIILNFTAGTVQGFSLPGMFDVPVRITAANDVTVTFEGSAVHLQISQTTISGSLDRVTGDVYATSMMTNTQTQKIVSTTNYELQCQPVQRMF
jgi:hypothetical protein